MRWTKAPRIVETKLKSGKIKFQVVEHVADGRRIRKSVGLENVDPTNRGLLSETRLIAKTMEGDLIKEFYNQKAGLPSSNAQVIPMCEAIEAHAKGSKRSSWKRFALEYWGDKVVGEITTADCVAFLNAVQRSLGPASHRSYFYNGCFSPLKRMVEARVLSANPADGVRPPVYKGSNSHKALTSDEMDLWNSFPTESLPSRLQPYHLAGIFLFNTGQRWKSLCSDIHWRNIKDGYLKYSPSKTRNKGGVYAMVKLNAKASGVLDHLDRSSELVFPDLIQAEQNAPRMLEPIREAVGIESRITCNTFRHSFFTRLADQGVDVWTMMQIGAWTNSTQPLNYINMARVRANMSAVDLI